MFFGFNVPHCTRENNTESSRAGIAYHFLRTDGYRWRAFPLPQEAEWITPVVCGPESTSGAKEYGFAADTWVEDIAALQNTAAEEAGVESYKTVRQDM